MLDGYDCCSDPDGCNGPATLEDTLSILGHLRNSIYEPIELETVDAEIRNNRPVCCGLLKGGAGHFVVITGWYPSGAETFVTIQDPTYGGGNRAVEYRKLLQGYRDASWVDTYVLS